MKGLETFRLRKAQIKELQTNFGSLIIREKSWLLLACLALAGEIAMRLIMPWPIKFLFDALLLPVENFNSLGISKEWISNSPELYVAIICGALLFSSSFAAIFGYFRQLWAATAGQRMIIRLRKRLYSHLQRLSLGFHNRQRLGDILLRITGDIPALRDVLSETLIDALGRSILAISMLTILIVLDPFLACVALISTLLVALLSTLSTQKIAKVAKRQRMKESVISHSSAEMLQSLRLIKALGQEDTLLDRFARRNRSAMRQGLKATRLQAALSRNIEILFAVATAVVLAIGVLRVSSSSSLGAEAGSFSAGDLLVFLSYMRSLNKPLRKISRSSSRVGKASACGQRVMEILQEEPDERDLPGATEAPRLEGEITFDQISFSYSKGQPILQSLSLKLAKGEKVALVGRNGAGKSTVLSLLLRFYDASLGKILIDGLAVEKYTIASLRKSMALVLQDGIVFSGSIRENLELSSPEATEQQMIAALAGAQADFVLDHPDGLDMELTEHGNNLSGGERRKLAIASALLRDAPILVLDEPTTNIDAHTRNELLKGLPGLINNRTTLVVTHDFEMLELVDRIVVLEDGRVADSGSLLELSKNSNRFRSLFPQNTYQGELD